VHGVEHAAFGLFWFVLGGVCGGGGWLVGTWWVAWGRLVVVVSLKYGVVSWGGWMAMYHTHTIQHQNPPPHTKTYHVFARPQCHGGLADAGLAPDGDAAVALGRVEEGHHLLFVVFVLVFCVCCWVWGVRVLGRGSFYFVSKRKGEKNCPMDHRHIHTYTT
jgi:hypothetical protein